jgi:hypothetical protein
MRVALSVTCVNNTPYPSTGVAIVRLLERLGHEVDFPGATRSVRDADRRTGHGISGLGAVVFEEHEVFPPLRPLT